jgi:uncharacterized protein
VFGLSFGKLLVLVAIIAAVLFGFAYAGRLKKQRDELAKIKSRLARQEQATMAAGQRTTRTTAAELTACPKCGAYADLATHRCGR